MAAVAAVVATAAESKEEAAMEEVTVEAVEEVTAKEVVMEEAVEEAMEVVAAAAAVTVAVEDPALGTGETTANLSTEAVKVVETSGGFGKHSGSEI